MASLSLGSGEMRHSFWRYVYTSKANCKPAGKVVRRDVIGTVTATARPPFPPCFFSFLLSLCLLSYNIYLGDVLCVAFSSTLQFFLCPRPISKVSIHLRKQGYHGTLTNFRLADCGIRSSALQGLRKRIEPVRSRRFPCKALDMSLLSHAEPFSTALSGSLRSCGSGRTFSSMFNNRVRAATAWSALTPRVCFCGRHVRCRR